MATKKSSLYLIDKNGSVPPELNRFLEVSGFAHRMGEHSGTIGEIIASLRDIASQLGSERDGSAGRQVSFTFESEAMAKEELIRISDFLKGINFKIWGVSRMISNEAEKLADNLQVEENNKFDAEMKEFLTREVVGLGNKVKD